MLQKIVDELRRIGAEEIRISQDDDFDPQAGPLAKVQFQQAQWRLLPEELYQLLVELPSGAGGEAVRQIIERKAMHVWHGEAPQDARDAPPPDSAEQ